MSVMVLPILRVLLCRLFISDDQKVLGVFILCRLGEIEAPADHGLPIDDYDLIKKRRAARRQSFPPADDSRPNSG
jgi:hypothetical protein